MLQNLSPEERLEISSCNSSTIVSHFSLSYLTQKKKNLQRYSGFLFYITEIIK